MRRKKKIAAMPPKITLREAAHVIVSKYGARIRRDPDTGEVYISVAYPHDAVGDEFFQAIAILGLENELYEWSSDAA